MSRQARVKTAASVQIIKQRKIHKISPEDVQQTERLGEHRHQPGKGRRGHMDQYIDKDS